jgi:hypothetical protein
MVSYIKENTMNFRKITKIVSLCVQNIRQNEFLNQKNVNQLSYANV